MADGLVNCVENGGWYPTIRQPVYKETSKFKPALLCILLVAEGLDKYIVMV